MREYIQVFFFLFLFLSSAVTPADYHHDSIDLDLMCLIRSFTRIMLQTTIRSTLFSQTGKSYRDDIYDTFLFVIVIAAVSSSSFSLENDSR